MTERDEAFEDEEYRRRVEEEREDRRRDHVSTEELARSAAAVSQLECPRCGESTGGEPGYSGCTDPACPIG